MANRLLKNKKGQGTLEVALAFIMAVLLLAGITNIWFWMNNQIVERQVHYQNTRADAGKINSPYILVWPPEGYRPEALTEDQVLRGEY